MSGLEEDDKVLSLDGAEIHSMMLECFQNKECYIKFDDYVILNFIKPVSYADYQLGSHKTIKDHELMKLENVRKHFQQLLDQESEKIKYIMGMPTSYRTCNSMLPCCDYCMDAPIPHDGYYCDDCHKDMCELCYRETDEGFIEADSRHIMNYDLDKQVCRDRHALKSRIFRPIIFFCDVCKEDIFSPKRYSDFVFSLEWENDPTNFDVCLDCCKTADGQRMIEEKQLKLVDNLIALSDVTGFGSMLDWIPILQDSGGNQILVNLNQNSPLFNRYAFKCVSDYSEKTSSFYLSNKRDISQISDEINESMCTLDGDEKPIDIVIYKEVYKVNRS